MASLSSHVDLKFSRPRPKIKIVQCRIASPRLLVSSIHSLRPPGPLGYLEVSLSFFFEQSEQVCPLENFDTEPHSSYCYEVEPDNRLESVANAHTAADLHVRPVPLTALVSRAVDAANPLRNTSCLISRNRNDST
jgi:hypothetical protein